METCKDFEDIDLQNVIHLGDKKKAWLPGIASTIRCANHQSGWKIFRQTLMVIVNPTRS